MTSCATAKTTSRSEIRSRHREECSARHRRNQRHHSRADTGGRSARAGAISAVTRAELRYGVARRPDATRLSGIVEALISGIETLPWGPDAADAYGSLRAHLERVDTTIGMADTMIAAHALVADATLITANGRHFARVPGLDLQIVPPS